MTTKSKSRRSEQEKAERAAAFREMALQLDGELKQGKHTERLTKAQKEVQGLERYSPLNQLLILTQCPHVTEVHGYVEWQQLGYQVRKGETAIAIRAPHTKQAEDGEEAGKVGFHRTYVFDWSQVDTKQEPEQTKTPEATGSDQDGQEPEATPAAE